MRTQAICLALVLLLLCAQAPAQWVQTNGPYSGATIWCFAVSGTNLFAGTLGGGVFRSTNNGTTWTAVNSGLTYTYIRALAVSGSNLFVGTGGGFNGDEGDGVFLSTNSGTTWTAASSGLTNTDVWSLAVSSTNLFAGAHDGDVFRSTNNGTSWTAVNVGATYIVYTLALSGTNLFAGTGGEGVFRSTNSGASWIAVNTGLGDYYVSALAVADINLFAGAWGSGVWTRPLSEMITDVESKEMLPSQFALAQNYPNPFNPITTIKFELPKSMEVRLSVYDMLGREASVLVNERREAGVHEAKFDGSELSSGVYFYRLQAGDFVQTRRLLLLR